MSLISLALARYGPSAPSRKTGGVMSETRQAVLENGAKALSDLDTTVTLRALRKKNNNTPKA
ncbi:hypothetical protein [Pseudomonas tolaasii]|uniref:hypothetical protein n=1 Tax=Pseudomonas tolaasii TaxID=29442 RepID=UPI0015A04A7F|nr:hypothetical protein [Pseudomonas tolaasii]MBW1246735.1 hypothetical protein [Pseudomonas tolaasii]NVZ44683.1 hypothetical protein [Pseudomonas tolaasii]NWA47544.1 hypothetical protein [Pseudomonas tolaasii]QXQ17061.1 hypothetical protein I7845_19490 [Pseudomonas tolaasii]WLH50198.1 hypothetical protein PSH62_19190 [Pseudomonas tolaasii]